LSYSLDTEAITKYTNCLIALIQKLLLSMQVVL
jgi:hypothetical protein